MDGFVTAYSKTTGIKQRVPAHYLDHPVLGANLRRTPSEAARARPENNEPNASWTHERLDAYAADQTPPVDLTGATTRTEKVAAIAAVRPQTPDGALLSDQTPA